jgi:hypothetical protein
VGLDAQFLHELHGVVAELVSADEAEVVIVIEHEVLLVSEVRLLLAVEYSLPLLRRSVSTRSENFFLEVC